MLDIQETERDRLLRLTILVEQLGKELHTVDVKVSNIENGVTGKGSLSERIAVLEGEHKTLWSFFWWAAALIITQMVTAIASVVGYVAYHSVK